MFRKVLMAVAATGMAVTPVHATQMPPLRPALVQRLALTCTAQGALEHGFGDVWTGPSQQVLDPEEGAHNRIEITRTARTQQIYDLSATISYERLPGTTLEDRYAAADALYASLETAIADNGRYENRREGQYGGWTWDVPGSDVTLSLTHNSRVAVTLTCNDHSLEVQHVNETLGNGRVTRPLKPVLELPPPVEAAGCHDPGQARAVTATFMTVAMQALDHGNAASRYSDHLADWWGQQLVDAGVWTKATQEAFVLRGARDPVVIRELRQQMPRAQAMLDAMMAYADADEAGDTGAACTAAVRGLDVIRAITASNETQRNSMLTRYRTEAARLGVTLED
ncbi:MAG: hypothetical protein EON48_11910 [Acetobacteraceae bacterium]|nr:MAG: hypothetical protein EON48_11910 [Acetobacteraceae bacterium]